MRLDGFKRMRWIAAAVAAFALLSLPLGAGESFCAPTRSGRRACIEGAIFLRVPLPKKSGLAYAARKYTGSADSLQALETANPLSKRRRLAEARIPVDLLLAEYRDEAMAALFPKDRRTSSGWEHVWGTSPRGEKETWSDLARWFTGSSRHAQNLSAANPKVRKPKAGTAVLIPEGLLLSALRKIPPPEPPPGPGLPSPAAEPALKPPEPPPSSPAPAPSPATAAGQPAGRGTEAVPLSYGRDAQGEYAEYRLQAGEALYSAVVVRFTGTLSAEDVKALAQQIAKRSGIKDVTGIPVGYPVKIPLEDLLPQYLPASDARFQAWEKNQEEVQQFTNTYKNSVLDGVVVILDPGHGGLDRGAMAHGVWEDSYVYDIACRVREGLESRTKARVLMTVLDPGLGYRPQDRSDLAPNKGAVVLTHPWFRQDSSSETRVEVNLRWHLANQYFLRLRKEGVDPERVVFTSIHADSLYPTLRGSMFYIPGTAYRSARWCSSGDAYKRYEEWKAQGCYQLSDKDMRRSEGLSLQFARDLESAFASAKLALHPYSPTRDHVIRNRRSWVPAVLRNSIVPCAVLLEVCNLNNPKDAALIADPAFRQSVADAYIAALIKYYS
jgi:N-acetylmuramoyl-L-alanine amidase